MGNPIDGRSWDIDENALLEDLQHLSGLAWAHEAHLKNVMRRTSVRLALLAARPLRPVFRRARSIRRMLTSRSVDSGDPCGSPFDDRAYTAWLAANDAATSFGRVSTDPTESAIPMFALIMPVCDPPIAFLQEAIESVLSQTLRDLHLVLVDDGCTDEAVIAHLRKIALSDDRVALVRNPRRCGIGLATAVGVRSSDSEWLGFVDHDDILRPEALSECARIIAESRTISVVYTDEDKVAADGRRFHPRFKGAFDPVRLLHENYMNHFWAVRRSLLEDSDGAFSGVDGAQDWNLALTITRRLERHEIGHVPYVGYSWRQSDGQFSQQHGSSAMEAASRAVQAHLHAVGSALLPRPHPQIRGALRLVAAPGNSRPEVTAIIPIMATGSAAHRRTMQNVSAWLEVGCERIVLLCAEESARRRLQRDVGAGAPVTVKRTTTLRLGAALAEGLADETDRNGNYFILGEEVGPIGRSALVVLTAYLALPEVGMVGPRVLGPGAHLANAGGLMTDAGIEYVGRDLDPFNVGYFGEPLIPREVAMLDPRALFLEKSVVHGLIHDATSYGSGALVGHFARGCWRRGTSAVFVPSVSVLRRERDGDPADVRGEMPAGFAEDLQSWMRTLEPSDFPGVPRLSSALEVHGPSYRMRPRRRAH